MQRAALAVAEHAGEIDNPRLARRQQLLAGEFRRGAQIERPPLPAGPDQLGGESMQMGLVAGRNLQRCGLDLDKSRAANQARKAAAMRPRASRYGRRAAWTPGHQNGGLSGTFTSIKRRTGKTGIAPRRSLWCGPKPRPPAAHDLRIIIVKVIASPLRKGNIVDLDGKLYVVLNAENFHPGKGTPTTQVDMRRISDGVKTQMRYKTTDQVERAHVEDRNIPTFTRTATAFIS